jgi:uncharacterized protein (TIGR03437 family)
MKRFFVYLIPCCLLLFCSLANGAAPRIFFSDLESGPNAGGENNAGAYVTIYGKRFGASQNDSFITVGGGRVANYPIWTDTKVTFQLGPSAATGDIVLTTAAGVSNGIPFTIRPGNIYFIAVSGNDSQDGSFASPWRTIPKARTIKPGDIVYARNGVAQTTEDDQGWHAAFTLRPAWCGGNLPRALVAYPGATVTIGNVSAPDFGIRSVDTSADGGACTGSWLFAGLVLRGLTAVNIWGPSSNWRFVGNDLSCPNGDGASGCFAASLASDIKLLGNNLHESGKTGASALYHGIYPGTDSNNVEIGWNVISDVHGGRGIHVYSHPVGNALPDTGYNQFGISIHDNVIHNTQCDAIILSTVDPSKGKVEVYNNVIYDAGLETAYQDPARRYPSGNYSCINVVGEHTYGPPGSGIVEIFNNTLYNCGPNPNPPYANSTNAIVNGGVSPDLKIRITNNIIYQPNGVPYLLNLGTADGIQGSNNLFFGNGPAPSLPALSNSINADPLFGNLAAHDFHLNAGSPARRTGVETPAIVDIEGSPRGGSAGWDLGALQVTAPSISSLSCTPAAIVTPGGASCEFTLTMQAPDGGLQLALSSSDPSLTIAPAALVPAGAAKLTVHVDASAVGSRTAARISARLGDSISNFDVWLLPSGSPAALAVVNAASFLAGPVAAGGMVAIFGLNLGPADPVSGNFSGDRFTTTLAGTTVFFDGTPAPLLAVSAGQVNAVVPYSVDGKTSVRVEIDAGGRRSNPLVLSVAPTAPGVFTMDSSGQGQVVAVNENGSLNSAANPAPPGSWVFFYAAGLGQTDPPGIDGAPVPVAEPFPRPVAGVSVQMGGIDARVLYSGGAPTFIAGLHQINVEVPPGIAAGSKVPVTLTAGGNQSQTGATLVVGMPQAGMPVAGTPSRRAIPDLGWGRRQVARSLQNVCGGRAIDSGPASSIRRALPCISDRRN